MSLSDEQTSGGWIFAYKVREFIKKIKERLRKKRYPFTYEDLEKLI
jgi:hypothetical protein